MGKGGGKLGTPSEQGGESMKYPQSVPMPRDVENWLGGELEARGIDAVFYTRYILSLMQQDPFQPQSCDWSTKAIWSGDRTAEDWQSWDRDALKRLAAIRCLMSASSQKCEVESLVDELCIKLKEIDSGADDKSDCAFEPQVSPYVDFEKSFAPLLDSCGHRDAEEANAASVWTRGILRASLDKPNPPSHETLTSPLDCLSLNYANLKMFANVINYGGEGAEQSKEDVKRLYERSTKNRNLDKVIAKLDSAIPQIWNPDSTAFAEPKTPMYAQNQAYFYNNRKLFSPTLFKYRYSEASFVPPPPAAAAAWSLGGVKESEPCVVQNEPTTSKAIQENDSNKICNKVIEHELPISARTHFRPIRPHAIGTQPKVYADGTTFSILTDLKSLQFQRSESGTLFLDTGKYMEYKNDNDCSEKDDFVPKFRVRQSNEKTCQTEDIGVIMVEDYESDVSSESDDDDLYFPGDDEWALNYEIEKNLPRQKKVAKVVTAKLDDKWENPDKLSGEANEIWVQWGEKNEALVDNLIGDDNDDEDAHMGDDTEQASSVQWPQFNPTIWNSNTSLSSCGTCKRDVGTDEDCSQNQVMPKREWQEIWGQPQCKGCKDEENASKPQQSENTPAIERKECKSPIFRSAAFVAVKNTNSWTPDYTEPNRSEWVSKELSPGWKWPKLGAALSAYLEESRMRAVELLSVWSPNNEVSEATLKKTNDVALRDLWSPPVTEEDFGLGREVWSPMLDQQVYVTASNNNKRPVTYGLLREELSEDGEELLSDLSYLHLQQLGSLDVKDGSDLLDDGNFSTAAPSPVWDEGHRFVSLWATWNLIEVIGHGRENQAHVNETAQKERKRRHSSSQRMCELYVEGECRRPHCRFVHGDDLLPSDSDVTPPSLHFTQHGQRAFTL